MNALSGIRVLDLTRLLPGPYATMLLAALGAQVDKIEEPSGDPLRHMPPFEGEESVLFSCLNRGKRSIVLDLKRSLDVSALLAMVKQADVLIEQFRPGTLERLGLSWQVLSAANPRLILCRMSGYGQFGALAARAGHDLNYLARAGLLGMQGPPGQLPAPPGFQVADIGGALFAVIGIQGALREREGTGLGRVLDVSLMEASMAFSLVSWAGLAGGGAHVRGAEPLTGGLAVYRTYEAKDGRWVALASLEPKFWKSFSDGIGLPFDPAPLVPGPHQAGWHAKLSELFRTKTRDEWAQFGERHDCCLEPVLSPEEALADDHLRSHGRIDSGLPASIVSAFGGTAVGPPLTSPAPRLGEHTESALREIGVVEAVSG